jgi:hypothetical protein
VRFQAKLDERGISLFPKLKLNLLETIYILVFLAVVVRKLVDKNYDILHYWLYMFQDKPWTPAGTSPIPIIGEHYFGDLQLPLIMLSKANPFEQGIFNNILPFGYAPFSLFAIQFNKISIIGLGLFMILIFVTTYFKLLQNNDTKTFCDFIPLLSVPTLFAIDRGAPVILALSTAVLSVQILNKQHVSFSRNFLAIILIAYSVSAKIYLILFFFIIYLLMPKIRKRILLGLAATAVLNFIISYLFGGPQKVVKQVLYSLFAATGNNQSEIMSSGSSFSALIFFLIRKLIDEDLYLGLTRIPLISLLPGLVYLSAIIMFTQLKKIVPDEIKIILALSTIQSISPISFFYTATWAVFAFAFFKRYLSRIKKSAEIPRLKGLNLFRFLFISTFFPIPILDWEKLISFLQFVTIIYFIYLNSIPRRTNEQ